MKNKFKKLLTLSAIMPVSAIAISCGTTFDDPEKVAQDKLLNSNNAKLAAEKFWLDQSLASLYGSTSAELTSNEKYKQEALNAYKVYVASQNLKDPFYLWNQVNSWNLKGLFNESAGLNSLKKYKSSVDETSYWLAYNKDETDVKFNTQKLLLVLKYFELNDAKLLQKVNQNYALQKDNYDNNQFNLIDYVLNKKLVQSWSYDNQSDKNDVFSTLTRSIQNVSDYNNLLKNTPALLNVASQELLFNANNSAAEVTMGGFANLKALPAEVKLSYDLQSLLQVTEAKKLSGFYNYQNNTLVPLSNTSLEAPVFVSRDGQLLKVSYFNQVAPIKDTIDGKDVLSFNKTAYASKLFNLEVNLAAYDDKLYNTAKSAFVALGYLLEVNNETLKEKLAGEDFVAK